jgi:hypothetical protein
VRALSPRPTPLHYLVAEFFDFSVHVDLPAQEGRTTRRLRQDGAGRGFTFLDAYAQETGLFLRFCIIFDVVVLSDHGK